MPTTLLILTAVLATGGGYDIAAETGDGEEFIAPSPDVVALTEAEFANALIAEGGEDFPSVRLELRITPGAEVDIKAIPSGCPHPVATRTTAAFVRGFGAHQPGAGAQPTGETDGIGNPPTGWTGTLSQWMAENGVDEPGDPDHPADAWPSGPDGYMDGACIWDGSQWVLGGAA